LKWNEKVFKAFIFKICMKKGKKKTGGRYRKSRKKKKFELPRQARKTKLGEYKKRVIKGRGGNSKEVLLSIDECNLIINGKSEKAKIKNVLETPSNKFLARQNLLMKGATVQTDKGKAKITNRPGQEGQVQCILID
jgi:small subunit ribosomal protein S8e